MAAGEWLHLEPRGVTRQLTVYEHAITFTFVDLSSSRGLEKFGEDIPTSSEITGPHTLNFRQKFKFLQLIFFSGDPVPVVGCAR